MFWRARIISCIMIIINVSKGNKKKVSKRL